MNNKFLTIVVVGAAVSAGTYFGLNTIKPYHKEEPAEPATVTVDQVFSGGLKTPEEQPAADKPAEAGQPAAAAATTTEPATKEDLAAAQPGEGSSSTAPASSESTAAPAETSAAAAPVESAAPAPAAEEPAPAPEPTKPAPAPKKAPKSKAEATTAAPAPVASDMKTAPTAPAVSAWWGKPDSSTLSVTYAGSASDQKAVAILFNGEFDDAKAAAANLKLQDSKGAAVAGSWQLSDKNKRMLLFPVKANGKYTLSLKQGLKDNKGRELGKDLHGPVEVK